MHIAKFAIIGFILVFLSATAHGMPILAQSTFDTDNEGWRTQELRSFLNPPILVGSAQVPDYNATGFISDQDVGSFFTYYAAPASFLGDKSAAFGGSITFDMAITVLTPDGQGVGRGAILVGGGITLYYDLGIFPAATFTAFTVDLSPSTDWKLNSLSGSTPTNAEMTTVLGNLTALYLNQEWASGTETVSLDNVVMAAVPEPSILLLLGFGLAGLGLFRRRRTSA